MALGNLGFGCCCGQTGEAICCPERTEELPDVLYAHITACSGGETQVCAMYLYQTSPFYQWGWCREGYSDPYDSTWCLATAHDPSVHYPMFICRNQGGFSFSLLDQIGIIDAMGNVIESCIPHWTCGVPDGGCVSLCSGCPDTTCEPIHYCCILDMGDDFPGTCCIRIEVKETLL